MLTIKKLADGVFEVKPTGKLQEGDFRTIATQVDEWTRFFGQLRLLVDATAFDGWADTKAAGEHFRFVRDHQKKIERIAILAGHAWQHWLALLASAFVHPSVKVFDANERAEAESWLRELQRKAS